MSEIKEYIKFGIYDITENLIPINNDEVKNINELTHIVYAAKSFKITATLNPVFNKTQDDTTNSGNIGYIYNKDKKYLYFTKEGGYRKMVEWDFGDGYITTGQYAEHSYRKPGRYKISCTFFDKDRRAIKNEYTIYVVVKDIAPTSLMFVDSNLDDVKDPSEDNTDDIYKDKFYCSKIDKIAKIKATLSNWASFSPSIIPTRILSKDSNENTYFDVKDYKFNHLHKYYTFLEKSTNIRENEMGYTNIYNPVEKYKPSYTYILGKFDVESIIENKVKHKRIILKAYIVNPYTRGNNEKNFSIIDPNKPFNTEKIDNLIDIKITEVSSESELPHQWELLFKRGYVDIFYKSDYPNKDNEKTQISFQYDFENQQITDLTHSAPNYITQIPLIRELEIIKTPIDAELYFAFTSTGFLWNEKDNEESDIKYHDINKITVDKHLNEMLIKGYYCPVIIIPYILDRNGYSPNEYYIPKDINFIINAVTEKDNDTLLYIKSDELNLMEYVKYMEFVIGDVIDLHFLIVTEDGFKKYYKLSSTNKIDEYIRNVEIIDHLALNIPKEKLIDIDVPRLINTYTPHNMFKEAIDTKQYLIDIFKNKDMLSYIITRSEKFIDDNVNKDRNYIDKLVSMLQSLGIDISQYEESSFSSVNELRDFTRLLSMNHSELIGNNVNENIDILITPSYKGKHVGKRIYIDDTIVLNKYNEIIEIIHKTDKKDKDGNPIYDNIILDSDLYSEWIVIEEDYSHITKLASFHSVFEGSIDFNDYEENKSIEAKRVTFDEYNQSWGWNLLLSKCDSKVELLNRIDTYYTFYLLNKKDQFKRIDNFIDEKYLTNDILDEASWNDKWGITLDILIKIILQSFNFEQDDTIKMLTKAQGTTLFSFLLVKENSKVIEMNNILERILGTFAARSIPSKYRFKWDDEAEKNIINIDNLNKEIINNDKRTFLHQLEIFGDMRGFINENIKAFTEYYYRVSYIKGPDMIGEIFMLKAPYRTLDTDLPQSIMLEYRPDDPDHQELN